MNKLNLFFTLFKPRVLVGFTKSPRVLYISLAVITLLFLNVRIIIILLEKIFSDLIASLKVLFLIHLFVIDIQLV